MRNALQRLAASIIGIGMLALGAALSGSALADPPSRVARLGYISGPVSFSPAGEDVWAHGVLNRPLVAGDRLWVAPGGRAELQVGVAALRMGSGTSATLLNLDDRVVQVELTRGTLNIRVRQMRPGQVIEVDTPNLAYTLLQPGNYRIEVDPDEDATTVIVRDGLADVVSEGLAFTIPARRAYRYYGIGLRDYDPVTAAFDEFDRWSFERDRRAERSSSLRYVSSDLIGYEDLDAYGAWRTVAGVGPVWLPTRVAAGWAPYRDGHWSWIEPWGWTWVDDAPWGFAVSHYGRWTDLDGTWGWVPGPPRQQAIYAPALVGFIGGDQPQTFGGSAGIVGWFALGPRDLYRPSYVVSQDYFVRVNSSNTIINNVNIATYYNDNSTRFTYFNQRVPGAVIAVPASTFVQSQPVSRAALRLSNEQIFNAPVSSVAAVAPARRSVIGDAAPVGRPPIIAEQRPIIARMAPPPPQIGFAARESALAATPGRPLSATETQRLRPAAVAAAAAPVVVAAPTRPALPMTSAQPSQPSARDGGRVDGGQGGQRGRPESAPMTPDASGRPQVSQPAQAPFNAPPDQRGAPGQRGRIEMTAPTPEAIGRPSLPAQAPLVPQLRQAPQAAPQPLQPQQPQQPLQPQQPAMRPQPMPQPAQQVPSVQPAPQPAQPPQRPQTAPQPAPQPVPQTALQPAPRPAPQAPAAAPSPQPPMALPQPMVGRPQPVPQPAAQSAPNPEPPAARPQPVPQSMQPPAARPQPAPAAERVPAAQPVPGPAAAPADPRAPFQRGRAAPEQPAPAGPAVQPPAPGRPSAPPAPTADAGSGQPRRGPPTADDKQNPEQARQEEQRQEEEKRKRGRN